ncbi:MAG: hypothetical protein GQ477_03540 [Nanohaloarchaea archaeon]|nr:hypothetical protein [Candidatus Nanohaloarchaea archaeon]
MVERTEEKKIRAELKKHYGAKRITEAVGKVVDIKQFNGENDVIVDIGNIYVHAIDRMIKRAKIGEYVYFTTKTIYMQNVEKIEDEKHDAKKQKDLSELDDKK